MLRKTLYTLFICFLVSSCFVKKKTSYSKNKERKVTVEAVKPISKSDELPRVEKSKKGAKKANAIIKTALTFSGVRYKYGGTTKKGMDCSGLLYVSFNKHDVSFPRVSRDMANKGKRVKVGQVRKGDLLFFKTTKRGKKINHVGLVVKVKGKEVQFLHATSSRGVIVSSLREGYWNSAFVKATRVL